MLGGYRKAISILLVFGLIFSSIIFTGCTEEGEDNEVIVGTSADFPPFEYKDENGTIVGFDVEMVRTILKDQGYEVEVKDIAFDSLIPNLQQEKIDVIAAAMTITDVREEQVDFSNPYYEADQSVLVGADSDIQIESAQDLEDYTVGAQTGTTGADWVQSNLVENGTLADDDFRRFETYSLSLIALQNGNIDAVVLDKPVALAYADQPDFEIKETIETNEEYGIAVRNGDEVLLDAINEGLAEFKGTEEWNGLVQKYFSGSSQDGDSDGDSDQDDQTKKIIVGTSADFPPFEYMSDGNIVGFDIDLIKTLLAEQGYEVEIRDYPFTSLISALEDGKVDVVIAAMVITEEREEKVDFSDPYFSADQSILVKSGSGVSIDEPQDLVNYTVGAQTGTTGSDWIDQNLVEEGNLSEDDFERYNSYGTALTGLTDEHIDALILDKTIAEAYEGQQEYEILDTIVTGEEFGIAVNTTDDELLNAINEGLAEFKGTVEWNNLVKYHFE